MGKKRTRQQSSNGVMNGDSSESDGDQNTDKSPTAVKACQHAGKSIEQNQVKKNIHLEDIENNNFCLVCSKQGQSIKGEEIWVCLRCGAKACSLEHSQRHNEIPHSDSHALSLKLSDKTVWCHLCKSDIPASSNKKLKGCVNNVENMYEKYLQGPTPPPKNSAPKMETVNEEEKDSENKVLEAIPLLPLKIRTPPYGFPVKGLSNLGNTCYFNSVIQCLAQTPNLTETLKGMEVPDKEININLKSGKTLSGTLEKWDGLCESLCETLCEVKAGGPTFMPQKLLTLLRKRVPQFRGSDQHDSHELLRHLLDSVRGQDLKRYRRLMLNELGLSCVESTEKVDAEKTKELKQLDREVTDTIMLIPDQVFRGFLVSRLECQECRHSSECVESFLDLSLPVTSEKPQPPSHRRKGCGGSEEKGGTAIVSKHQLKKERKQERKKNRGKHHVQPQQKKERESGQGESLSAILEKGESDAADGDIESEGSDKKFENRKCESEGSSLSINAEPVPGSPKLTRSIEVDSNMDYTKFPLCNGFPDISKLGINDPSQPQLKTIVRDAATIVKEDPLWESRLREDNGLSVERDEEDNREKKLAEPSEDLGRISEEGDQQSDEEDMMVGSLFDEMNSTDSSGECSVQTCLAQFTSIELMTGSNKVGCEQCTAHANKGKKEGKTVYTMSTKQFLIAEAPPVLILHLKRFQVQMSSFRKLSRHVSFPLELDLSPFCKDDLKKRNPKKLVYSLYGIVEHSGTFNGGHYVAYVKVDSGQWFCISDSYVSEVKESRVLQAQAYLLFYKSLELIK